MNKIIIISLALVTVVFAAEEAGSKEEVKVLKQEAYVGPTGYNFEYELSDGQTRKEEGELKNAGAENEALAVVGSYAYVAPDGQKYSVTFTADENGFQPKFVKE